MIDGRVSSRGQVLVIFVFAIIGLIGISGLAIDGTNTFSDRRHAQNAADTAALAAALARNDWEKSNGACTGTLNTQANQIPGCAGGAVNDALNIAGRNGYDNNPANNNSVFVYSPPIEGVYADCSKPDQFDCNDYIQVIISDSVNTWFARVLGIAQMHNKVEAVALSKYSPASTLYGGASLVQLDSGGCGFDLGGNASMTLNGGSIFVNSSDGSCAFQQNPCKIFELQAGATLNVVGAVASKCTPAPPYTQVPPSSQLAFPPAPLITPAPAECNGPLITAKKGGSWSPGHYSGLPSGKLDSGVYCVDSVQTQNSTKTDGTAGVFIYVKPTGGFQMNGGTFNLVAMTTGPYAGFLIYFYPTVRQNCTINAGSTQTLTGQVFLPLCDLTINGNSSPTGITTQLVAATFKWNGNSTNVFNDAGAVIPKNPEINKMGLFH